jgi:hypothetical protein
MQNLLCAIIIKQEKEDMEPPKCVCVGGGGGGGRLQKVGPDTPRFKIRKAKK